MLLQLWSGAREGANDCRRIAEKQGIPQLPPVGLNLHEIDAIQKEILRLGYEAMRPYYHPSVTHCQMDGACRYGINPKFLSQITAQGLRVAAEDSLDEVRGLELDDHPFYVMTPFQPERAALTGECPPLLAAFVSACSAGKSAC